LSSKTTYLAIVLCCTGIITVAAQSGVPLKLKQTIPLPGVEGRIDHFAFDPAGDRLFVCALGNNTVEVLDLRKGERVHSITGLGAPQGVAYIPELDRVFVANDKGGICRIYDGKSFQPVGELNFEDDADNVRYDEATKKSISDLAVEALRLLMRPMENRSARSNSAHTPKPFNWRKTAAEFS
jgi:DNA-binding beta-propeller fold protein YncE